MFLAYDIHLSISTISTLPVGSFPGAINNVAFLPFDSDFELDDAFFELGPRISWTLSLSNMEQVNPTFLLYTKIS